MKNNVKKIVVVVILAAICCLSILTLIFGTSKTYSAYTNVNVPQGTDVKVYVSGNDVAYDGKKYMALPNSTITVTVVNEGKLFSSMTIKSGTASTTYTTAVASDIVVPADGNIDITVETKEPYAEDKGKYFGNPYVLSREADVLALARILSEATPDQADFAQLGAEGRTAEEMSRAYYRLGTNLFISSSEFFGLGFRGKLPFAGCFDFDGYTATINLVRTSHVNDEFTFDNSTHIADYGFFAYIYGDGTYPCLVRNARLQGFIGLNTMNNTETINHVDHVNAGGVAGTAGENIVFDGIESTVSVSAQTRFADLYLGGIFGICSSSVEAWCDVRYDGAFNNVSGVTYGDGAGAIVGAYAGVLQNAGVNGVTIDGERSLVLANALGSKAGRAIAGGFVGVVEVGKHTYKEIADPRDIVIRNVTIFAEEDYSVSAVVNNSDSTTKGSINPDNVGTTAAIAGGIVGIVNRGNSDGTALADNIGITISTINFMRTSTSSGSNNEGRLLIQASTQDANSSAPVYAGGAVGYVYGDGDQHVVQQVAQESGTKYIFDCPVDVAAVQNGVGPAYAGGVFGYNSFMLTSTTNNKMDFGVVSPKYDYTVTATQSVTSSKVGSTFYNVCAGGFSSRLNTGTDFADGIFRIGNGRITAYREVGSTAIGDINAGGFVGRLLGYGTEQTTITNYDNVNSYYAIQSGTVNNATIYYSDNSYVEAACHSYDSINHTSNLGNNVCAGGAAGYVLGYKTMSNVSLIFDGTVHQSGKPTEYFVSGTQNGANNNDGDLKTEGIIGGMFGLVIDTKLSDINLIGDPTENSVVYFASTNSPNTASVGGLVGALWKMEKVADTTLMEGATVKNVHVAGKAYCEKKNADDTYDIYVGGAVGVFGNPKGGTQKITKVNVDNCVVDAIGEKTMLPYAGGVVAGMWWSSTTQLSYAIVQNSAITSTSIVPNAYAGGIVGLMQRSNVDHCLTQDTEVKAVSEQSNAYAGGIAARGKNGSEYITYCYSNASLNAQGAKPIKRGIVAIANKINIVTNDSGAAKNFFVYETAGTADAYGDEKNTNYSDYSRALYLTTANGAYTNNLDIAKNGQSRVYSTITDSQSSTMTIKSHNSDIAYISSDGLNVVGKNAGITYVGAYCTIDGTQYLLCSYPVTVDSATENGTGLLLTTENGTAAKNAECDEYIEYTYGSGTSSTQYVYFRRNIGNPDTIKKLLVFPVGANYLPQNIKFYDISTDNETIGTAKSSDTTDKTEQEKLSRIRAIIDAKGTACDVSAFNGRANVGFEYDSNDQGDAKKSVYFYANDNVRENTVIVMECSYGSQVYGVIVEFVPNLLTGITITPESGTPPLDERVENGVTHYIYTAGDVVRFSAQLRYYYTAPRSYVVETIYSGDGVTENGMVSVAANGVYTVKCRDLKNTVETTVIVEAQDEVKFSFAYSGAIGSFDRKMVKTCNFLFDIAPQPGYGLYPTITVTIGDATATAVFGTNSITVTFGTSSFEFAYTTDPDEQYEYEFTIGADFVDYVAASSNQSVQFSVTYRKIYSLVFISNYNGNDFFSTTVAAGERFADVVTSEFTAWTNALVADRYGYDFRGFYTLSKAGDVSAYGKSFDDMCRDENSVVSGTMRFYARWTYNITVEAPDNVTVTSSMSSSLLHEAPLIPLDSKSGFGFVTETPTGWAGTPHFDAFVIEKDGTYVKITDKFVAASQNNGYYISSEAIENYNSGYIYVKVYADSLDFNIGDDVKYDGSALYTDGIYTLTYNVNYGASDKSNLADVTFSFAPLSLPQGTSLRLFYQKDGSAAWTGSAVLGSAENSITLADFLSLQNGTAMSATMRNGATTEKFVVVVTLPYNTDLFGITAATGVVASIANYNYTPTAHAYGNIAPTADVTPDTTDHRSEQTFTLYPTSVKTFTHSGNTLTFAQSGQLVDGVVDHRHSGTRYMWQITLTDGGVIGDKTFEGFGTEVVRTTQGVYFAASLGSITIATDLTGYTVSLIEVRNMQQPGESPVINQYQF